MHVAALRPAVLPNFPAPHAVGALTLARQKEPAVQDGDAAMLVKLRGQYLPAVQGVPNDDVLPVAMQVPASHAMHVVAPTADE